MENARSRMETNARIASLEADNQNTIRDIREIKEWQTTASGQLNRIESKLAASGNPNWSAWAGWAAVILSIVFAIGGVVGWGFNRDMGRVEAAIIKLTDLTVQGAVNDATSTAIRDRLREDLKRDEADNHAAFKELDDRLQREMRAVNAVTDAKLVEIDKRFQAEMATVGAKDTARLDAQAERLDGVTARQTQNMVDNARQDEAIRWLKDRVNTNGVEP